MAGSGQTPAHLFFARVPRSAQDVSQIGQTYPNVLPDSIEAATSEVREMQKRAELARNFLVEYRKREHVQWKNRRAKVVTVDKFNAGDEVIVYCPSSQKGISTKLINQYRGPYEVVGLHKLSDGTEAQNVYDLKHCQHGTSLDIINIQRMVPYREGTAHLLLDLDGAAPLPVEIHTSSTDAESTFSLKMDDLCVGDLSF